MTTTVTCATDLLRMKDGVFLSFLKDWVRRRRLSLPLADYLMENDLHPQAEAAKWLATCPERPKGGLIGMSYPFPPRFQHHHSWWGRPYIWRCDPNHFYPLCSDLPIDLFEYPPEYNLNGQRMWFSTNLWETLCLPLDKWRVK